MTPTKPAVRSFNQLLRRFKARSYYRHTIERRRRLANHGKQRRRWCAWLIEQLRLPQTWEQM